MDITALLLIYWLPLGLLLIAWGSWDNDRLRDNAVTALVVIATATIAYAGIGFGLQFGGVGLRPDAPAGLQGLDRMWAFNVGSAGRWGLFGLEGFLLQAQAISPGNTALILPFFLHQLPLIITAALFPGLALAGRARLGLIVGVSILTAGFLIPVAGAWTWGNGWLSTLGLDARLGHGCIDVGGIAATFTVAGFVTLAALLALRVRGQDTPQLPLILSPARSIGGVLIFALGWLVWLNTDPLMLPLRSVDFTFIVTNIVLGAAAAMLVTLAVGWFISGQPNVPLAASGALGGLIAATAVSAFAPIWAALLTGVLTGLFIGGGLFLVARLHVSDVINGFVTAGLSGFWGLLAVGLFADGVYGAGWNNVGESEYLGVSGQGVTGLIARANLLNDPGQFTAQLTGALSIALLAFVMAWLLLRPWRGWNDKAGQPKTSL